MANYKPNEVYENWKRSVGDKYDELVKQRLTAGERPYLLSTPEWVSEFEKQIQQDIRYKEVAKTWEGSVVLVFRADPTIGLENDAFVYMDLYHGECKSAKLVPASIGRSGEYVLEAEYQKWEKILKRELNVVKEMALQKVKLVPFSPRKAATLAGAAQAALRLVDLAALVGAKYLDELTPEELEKFKELSKKLKAEYGF